MAGEHVPTGIWGLDQILLGGIRYPNAVLIQGAPGTGKTTLGLQMVYNGITRFGEPAIIISFEQIETQLLRDALNFGWDLERLRKEKKLALFFLSPEDFTHTFTEKETKAIGAIAEQVAELGCKRILIDSINHLWHRPLVKITPRKLLFNFMNALKALDLTAFVTAEITSTAARGSVAMEEYTLDTVIKLSFEQMLYRTTPGRFVEITKSRGQNFLEGRHPFRFMPQGIEIFPLIMPEPYRKAELAETKAEHCSSGIAGLDETLHGGYMRGTLNLVAGPTGTFKSAIGAHFLQRSVANNVRALLISFQEEPQLFLQSAKRIGLDLYDAVRGGNLLMRHYVPINLCLMEIYYEIERLIKEQNVRHIVVDNINDFRESLPNKEAEKYFVTLFLNLFKRHGVTAVLIEQIGETGGLTSVASIEFASLVDTIIYVGFVEVESKLVKVMSVFKMRGEFTKNDLREVVATPTGIAVTDKFVGLTGILQGAPTGHREKPTQ
jgi:circadian clock protein KaiC